MGEIVVTNKAKPSQNGTDLQWMVGVGGVWVEDGLTLVLKTNASGEPNSKVVIWSGLSVWLLKVAILKEKVYVWVRRQV